MTATTTPAEVNAPQVNAGATTEAARGPAPVPRIMTYTCRRCWHVWEMYHVKEDKARCPKCGSTRLGMRKGPK